MLYKLTAALPTLETQLLRVNILHSPDVIINFLVLPTRVYWLSIQTNA